MAKSEPSDHRGTPNLNTILQLFDAWMLREFHCHANSISAQLEDGRTLSLPLPLKTREPADAAPAPDQGADDNQCAQEIMRTIQEVGQRLTAMRLFAEMERRGFHWSERTICGQLARLVREGELTNRQDTSPRGYGFPEWEPEKVKFVPTRFQQRILEALYRKALRTDALANVVGDRSRLFRPGGIKELKEAGLVSLDPDHGYYRPDEPPPEMLGEDTEHKT